MCIARNRYRCYLRIILNKIPYFLITGHRIMFILENRSRDRVAIKPFFNIHINCCIFASI